MQVDLWQTLEKHTIDPASQIRVLHIDERIETVTGDLLGSIGLQAGGFLPEEFVTVHRTRATVRKRGEIAEAPGETPEAPRRRVSPARGQRRCFRDAPIIL